MPIRRLMLVALIASALCSQTAAASETRVASIGGPDSPWRDLREHVLRDQSFRETSIERAQLIWAGGTIDEATWQRALQRVRRGQANMIVAAGDALRRQLSAIGFELSAEARNRVTLAAGVAAPRSVAQQIPWASAPQAALRWRIERASNSTWLESRATSSKRSESLLATRRVGNGTIVVVGVQLADPSNRELRLWPYFNYLLYAIACEVSHRAPSSFADWPHAPVPGRRGIGWLIALLSFGWLVTLLLFRRAKRYSREHPEAISSFFPLAPTADANRRHDRSLARWHTIGFSRPLAGYLTLTGTLLLLFVPFYWLTNILIPNHVQPFPQAKGIWDFAWEALQVVWFLFDAGSFTAFVKYFAEYRVKDPQEAVRSAQCFVWWQILTGLIQVTLACLAAVVILPHTRYGYTSTFVILVALGQYPGFFGALTFFFQAYQRFDYNIGLDLLSDWVLRFALQIPFVLLFRAWGRAHPDYGEALGAAIGIGVGFHVSAVVTFAIAVVLYRRLGLRLLPLFLVHFDRKTLARMLSFGLRVVSGQVLFRMAKTVERVVISLLLLNYTEWLGIESQIHYNLMFLFPIAYRFFETAVAALSESHGNSKLELTRYYLARFLQVGGLYTAIGISLMWALGPTFVREAMDPQWARAADYLVLAAISSFFLPAAWLSDMLQKGSGRPGLFAICLGLEQALRLGLFLVLIPRYQFTGFYVALIATIALKVTGAWIANHLLIVRLRIYFWPMVIAPALTGLLNYALWRGLLLALPIHGATVTIAFFFAAALLSFFICFFVLGLLGGIDRQLAHELAEASQMTGMLKPITRALYGTAYAGCRISPLFDRFSVRLAPTALEEAHQLQAQLSATERTNAACPA